MIGNHPHAGNKKIQNQSGVLECLEEIANGLLGVGRAWTVFATSYHQKKTLRYLCNGGQGETLSEVESVRTET
jgi:hypothetical protein